MNRATRQAAVAGLLLLVGAVITIWPVVANLLGNRSGAELSRQYVEQIQASDQAELDQAIARANDYNAGLPPTALQDPWGAAASSGGASHTEYVEQLNSTEAIARIRIPAISVDLPVFHGSDHESLLRGAGHMYGSSLPVGGTGTHSVLAAHTGWQGRTFFDRLPELREGDRFHIDVAGTTLTYVVDKISVVEPWELEAVEAVEDADLVTLVTCYTPPGEHLQRMLVRGVRDTSTPTTSAPGQQDADQASPNGEDVAIDLSIQQWMWPRIGVTAAAVALMLLIGVRAARQRNAAKAAGTNQEG